MASSYARKDPYVEVPPRPKGDDGIELDRFKCPYCLVTKVITSDRKWKKYVFEDLQPYVCTHPHCELFDHFFKSQDEWYKHEVQRHRVKWFCNTENHPEYRAGPDFLTHMRRRHDTNFDLSQLSLLKDMFLQPLRAVEGQCNLCMRHSIKLMNHVSRHLQQIALFALARANETSGSQNAELNTQFSRHNKRGEKQPQVSKETQTNKFIEDQKNQPDLPYLDDDVEVIDVPDAAGPAQDRVTNKFSKARVPELQASMRQHLDFEKILEQLPQLPPAHSWDIIHVKVKYPGMKEGLALQLAQHVTARRHQFIYRQVQSEELPRTHGPDKTQSARKDAGKTDAEGVEANVALLPDQRLPPAITKIINRYKSLVSTSAPIYHNLESEDRTRWPTREFECPYCRSFILLPMGGLRLEHVLEDIQSMISEQFTKPSWLATKAMIARNVLRRR
ncbi:MAG: hypothetical protein M1840_001416 [Geoglossum simile]|nr:MAG: hypothetical protein M1840_001416 [Geoglossum simile]